MGLASPAAWFDFLPVIKSNKNKLSPLRSLYTPSNFPLSSSHSQLPVTEKSNMDLGRSSSAFVRKKRFLVSCSQLKVEDDLDAEACELVNGSELKLGEGSDTVNAHFFKAVKNNNGASILLLSDIFGFEDSLTRDFAYRVACNGYKYCLPDLFRGDPWSRDRAKAFLEQWIAKQDLNRVAKDIATSTQWMIDEFMAAEHPRKLGIVGFCWGGGRLLEVLARDQDSIFGTGVSFYGTRMDQAAASNVKVPVLFVTGDNDPLCPVDIVNEVEKKIGKDSKVVVFKGRGHGFVHRPESPEEDADAEEAFAIMRSWLYGHLLGSN